MNKEILSIAKEIKELNLLQQAEIKKIKRKSKLSNLELSQKVDNAKMEASLKMKESDFAISGVSGDLTWSSSKIIEDILVRADVQDFNAEENTIVFYTTKISFKDKVSIKDDSNLSYIKQIASVLNMINSERVELFKVNLNTNEIIELAI